MNLDLKLCKGTKVFLDRKNCANISKIEHVLRKFGVIIDEFLSKDVDYIVNDRTFHISNQLEKSRLQEGSQKSLLTRGQTLLMKSTSVNFPVSQSRIDPVQFSQKFNIPLITTTELKKVLQAKVVNHKKKSGNDPGLMMLETSFIKVEDFSQSFLPIFKKFLNFCIKSKEISNTSSKKVLKKNVNKEKFGYCECCDEYFNNLSLHRKTRRHMSFVTNVNFSSVDILIRGLPCLEDFCVLSDEGSTNSKVDKIELEENYRSSICNSCLDQNKLEASENFNKTNLAFTQQPSIINTNHYCQINKEVTNKVCTMAKENYGKFFSFQDTQCTTNDDISHSSRTADTKPGFNCSLHL